MLILAVIFAIVGSFWGKGLANKQSIEYVSKGRFFWKLFGRTFLRLFLLAIGLSLPLTLGAQNSEQGGEIVGTSGGIIVFISPYLLWVAWRETSRRYSPAPEVE